MPSDEDDTPAASVSDDDTPVEGGSSTVDGSRPESETDTETETEAADTESETESDDAESVADIETIVMDPDDVVDAAAYNGQEDIGRKGKAVFCLTPPFSEPVKPTIRHLEDDSTESKADDEVHLRPFRFIAEGRQVIEQRPTRRLAKEELDADDPDEAAIEAWIDEAMETWKTHVRENLVGSTDIYSAHGMAFVGVGYETDE